MQMLGNCFLFPKCQTQAGILDQQFSLMQMFFLAEVSQGLLRTEYRECKEDLCVGLYKMCIAQRHQAEEAIGNRNSLHTISQAMGL